MSKQIYSWKRFWCTRSGRINLLDDGYLCNPDAEWGKTHNPDLVTLETISHRSCLALLGEPGIGKTQALEAEQSEIFNKIQEQGDRVLFLNLRSYASEDRLVCRLFGSPEFQAWQAGTHRLYIFLDSFDECLLRVDTLATLLVDEFKQYQDAVHRLYLRIACRTAVWQPVLEEGLKEIWGENYLGVYELAPLRRIDVIEAAKAKEIPPDDFLKEVRQKNIVSLAIKPITLKFLLNTYCRHGGQFPPNQKLHELYFEGCKLLCEEINESRLGSKQRGNLDADQRIIVAARIAAITIFCNRFAVETGINLGNVPAEDILLQTLCFGHEKAANGREFEITRTVIEEVLKDASLFSSRGLHRMGWAHQTYAEFLAAWYLTQHEIPLVQIIELIFSSEDPDRKLIPQLHETAAWIASMKVDVFQEIIKTDPDVLLRSDIPTDTSIRKLIIDNLLQQYETGKLFDQDGNNYRNYAKLDHPKLDTQLRFYICDSSKQVDARDLAIDIAEVCKRSELQEDLLNLAFDSSQPIDLRVSAVRAIGLIGDVDTRLKLKPLAIEQIPDDKNDEIKGYSLQALWPDLLTAEELFQALTPPKKRNFFGSYKMFLEYQMVPKLHPDDLVVALDWLALQGVRCFEHPFEKLGDDILLKAWENFDLPEVLKGFTKVALIQWREQKSIITDTYHSRQQQFALSFLHNAKKRHALIKQVVLIISETDENPSFLFGRLTKNILVIDLCWMLEMLQISNCEKVQKIWAQLIKCSFLDCQDASQIDTLIVAIHTNDILYSELGSYFEAIDLNSDLATQLKTQYLEQEEMDERHPFLLLEPLPKDRVIQCLEQLELGNISVWWNLNRQMTLRSDSQYYGDEFELDLTKLPGWQEAEETTQERIVQGAKLYVQQQDDIDYEWIGTNTFDLSAFAGFRALHLLLLEDQSFIDKLLPEIWEKWTPVIIASASISSEHKDSYLELVKRAYLNSPKKSFETLIILMDKENKENKEHEHLLVINLFVNCWDERLKLALLQKANDPTLKPRHLGQLLEALMKQGLNAARELAKSLISSPLSISTNKREIALIAASVLVKNLDSSTWFFIWPLFNEDVLFGREAFELAAHRSYHEIQHNLNETQLADLYIWLVHQYPHKEDPNHNNKVNSITTRDCMARLRDGILSQLEGLGTLQACAEIKRLIQELPDLDWLQETLIDAQKNMRRKTWQPLTPDEFIQLVISREPSNSELSNQLDVIDQRTKKMEDEPKIENNIHISNSPINAPVGSSGVTNSQVNISNSDAKKGSNWGNWLGIFVAIIAIPLTMRVSGVFNEEFKQWFNHIFPSKVEQKPTTKSK